MSAEATRMQDLASEVSSDTLGGLTASPASGKRPGVGT